MSTTVALLCNLGLLSLSAAAIFLCAARLGLPQGDLRRRLLTGLVLGAVSAIVVKLPILGPFGATFDTRAAPMVLAGLYDGPIGGLVAAAIGAAARYDVGGPMALAGMTSIFLYAATGYAFGIAHRRAGGGPMTASRLLALAAVSTVVAVPAFFVGQPASHGAAILARFWPVMAIGNGVSIVGLGLLVEVMLDVARQRDRMRVAMETSQLARQAAAIGVWRYDFRADALHWDAVAFEVMGRAPVTGPLGFAFFRACVHEDDVGALEAEFERARRGSEPFRHRFRIRTGDGEVRHIRSRARYYGGTPGDPDFAIGVSLDVTREAELRNELVQRGIALDAASCGVVIARADGAHEIVYANEGLAAMTGYGRDAFIGRPCRFLNRGPEDQPELATIRQALADGEGCDVTLRNRRRDGSLFWNRVRISPIRAEGGRITHYVGIQEDVTESKRAELLFRSTFENVTNGCVVTDAQGTIRLFNAAAETIFGFTSAEAIGQDVGILMPEPDRGHHGGYIRAYLQTGEAKIVGIGRELTGRRKSGELFPMHLGIGVMHDDDGVSFIGTVSDLTEIKEVERRLLRAQRLEAVGQLTGGVAHDFNNIMTTVLGNAGLLHDGTTDEDGRQLAGEIIAAARRGAALTQRLLAFSRRLPLEAVDTDVPAVVDALGDMLRRTLGAAIELRIAHADAVWPAAIDPHGLESAIVNLAINARDAMPNGGVLSIRTDSVTVTAGGAESDRETAPGDYVRVSVEDTGSGMPPAVLERALEPFYTTKDVGKGSGLGLSMVYGFVEQSRGHMTIASDAGTGTRVALYLPRGTRPPRRDETPATAPAASRTGARILVVEDDPSVRSIPERVLRAAGYDVVSATTGAEGLARLSADGPFDLVFTDIVLPGGMNGAEMAETAREIQPGVRILLTSGYSDHVVPAGDGSAHDRDLLQKPYQATDLLDRIARILDAPS